MKAFSPWDSCSSIPNQSNLQCFLKCTTPSLKKRSKTCNGEAEETNEGFKLGELWQCFTEWSAYGVDVPIRLNNGDRVVQYYSPSLSALQLYTIKPISSSTGSGQQIGDDFRGRDKTKKTSSKHKSSDLASNPTTNDDDSRDIQITMDQCGYLCFQYNETMSPYDRIPFKEKISELSKEYSGLVDLHSKDLSPYSWMAIAWYPVYQVPGATNVRELSACFLTYHPLSSLSLGSENIRLGPEIVEGKRSGMSRVEEICLPSFAMVTYKMFGTLWMSPGTSDSDTVLCQRNAASYWLEQLLFHHHDFNFFMSRQFQNY
ncbi:uncharacterized protein LOC120150906 [Hibiscus syriacus]|uniref:uncharacterized protein LOC120150906 n=1 Tax=Hibiscus syriacus TaxID=106335 RepID=UPI0019217505|nr:uncharacterized protein LOC120150906 [Hibiscus syriacus]